VCGSGDAMCYVAILSTSSMSQWKTSYVFTRCGRSSLCGGVSRGRSWHATIFFGVPTYSSTSPSQYIGYVTHGRPSKVDSDSNGTWDRGVLNSTDDSHSMQNLSPSSAYILYVLFNDSVVQHVLLYSSYMDLRKFIHCYSQGSGI
jgi:hypothetical protein